VDQSRIAELLRPFLGPESLSGAQLGDISIYIDMLMRWNARVNLTAIRTPEDIVSRHFGESLFAARHLLPRPAESAAGSLRVADVGSGAGFPGLVLKIWAPEIELTLIESNGKKAAFLREVVRTLNLDQVKAFAGRAETAPAAEFDLVTLRAVEKFDAVLPVAASLVAPGRSLALLVGQRQTQDLAPSPRTISWQPPLQLPQSDQRVLLVGIVA
jgi:16S rRNA (guanine527-N7)-methyltransferase